MMGAMEIMGLPPADLPEVAFAGRSNVGKSTLINALVVTACTRRAPPIRRDAPREVNFFVAR